MYCTIIIEQAEAEKGNKIIFYANPEEGILLNAKQFENLVRKEVDMDNFDSWLDVKYYASEVINKSPEFYDNLRKEFIEDSMKTITTNILDEREWIRVEYTIE